MFAMHSTDGISEYVMCPGINNSAYYNKLLHEKYRYTTSVFKSFARIFSFLKLRSSQT
jgi:hypothetical protein